MDDIDELAMNEVYIGSEWLVIMGNNFRNPRLVDPDNPDLLQKDFSLLAGSPAENQGADLPVWG